MLVNLAANTRDAQEDAVAEQAERNVDVADAAEDAIAADRVEGPTCVPKNEQDKYDVPKARLKARCVSGDCLLCLSLVDSAGNGGLRNATYRSRFEAYRCALEVRP